MNEEVNHNRHIIKVFIKSNNSNNSSIAFHFLPSIPKKKRTKKKLHVFQILFIPLALLLIPASLS